MSWAVSFKLLLGEEIIEDSSENQHALIKPVYSILLTDKRVIFRFDGLGSLLKKSFYYNEIHDAKPIKRLNISYLFIKSKGREYLFNTSDSEFWSKKIMSIKENIIESSSNEPPL